MLPSYVQSATSDLVWGLEGTLYEKSSLSNGKIQLKYSGNFFVGYTGAFYPQLKTLTNSLLNGTFDWTFVCTSPTACVVSGTLDVLPALGYQPEGYPYPLGFGRLDSYTLAVQTSGEYTVSASKTYTTCNHGTTSTGASNQKAPPSNVTAHWSKDAKWALALGIVGGLLILLIPVLLFLAWRQRKNRYYLNDDDLVDPLKPDYGSLAINDIIEEADDLPRQ